MIPRSLSSAARLGIFACASLLAAQAFAQNSITLFGQQYTVQRFDYSASVQMPNLAFPQDPPIPFFESEGIVWAGNNTLLMSADDIADVSFGNPDNWVVRVNLLTTPQGQITGISYAGTILTSDPALAGFDLNPAGITINSGTTGLAAGGNLIVCNGDGIQYAYSLQTGTLGAPLGSLNLGVFNVNAEDVTFVPAIPDRAEQIVLINQDTNQLERYSTTGTPVSSFPIGAALPGGSAFLVPKGLTFISNTARLPTPLRNPEGVFIVAFDNNFPALQAFNADGSLIATEFLTTNAQPGGPSRLDLTSCINPLQLESLTCDPATGRLFLSNQGAFTDCNFLYILTPVTCRADFNGVSGVTVQDIFDFLSAWFANDPRADFNNAGGVTVQDIFDFLSAWFAGC